MLRNAFTKWLWDHRRSLLGWTLAVVFVGCGYAAFWPTVDDPAFREAIEAYPEGLMEALNYTDISTPAGYLNASVYGLVVGVLILVYGISAGTRTIAGDEDAGILDAVLAHPISRTRLALQRFAAFAASVLVVAAIFWLAMLALAAPARLEGISVGQFAAMHVQLALFAILFGAIAFGVGAAFGRRVLALVVGAAVAVWGFVADGIISQVDGLEWIENLSPFHWLTGGEPLRNGFQMGDAALMLLLTLLFVAAGTWAFNRRDVAV